MRAHYLQHVEFEGLGSIESWLLKAGYEITSTRFFEPVELPDPGEIDLLIIMGGPMSVNEERNYPWLVEEKRFIKSAIDSAVPTLGICLGAQLIASALGGEVFPNVAKEIGWFPVKAVDTKQDHIFKFPEEIEVFHWHGETFSLPANAIRIAESEACVNQAFQIGSNVIGLQFHLETTPGSAQSIVENCGNELIEGKYIQSESGILLAPLSRYETIHRLMERLLEYLQTRNA
jgi:GMP synthase-like glutamine amidotransferase